jgi:large subunit ribosomal protein L23
MLDPYRIVRKPLVTEKGTQQTEKNNAYNFMVDLTATKEDIKKAIEALFNVSVLQGAHDGAQGQEPPARLRLFQRPDWKRAVVTLKEGQKIEFV